MEPMHTVNTYSVDAVVRGPLAPLAEESSDGIAEPTSEPSMAMSSRVKVMPPHLMPKAFLRGISSQPSASSLPNVPSQLKLPQVNMGGGGKTSPQIPTNRVVMTAADSQRQRSPDRLPAVKALSPGGVRYTWDQDFDRAVRSQLMTADPTGLIGVLSTIPMATELSADPDPRALSWFREKYSEPPPTNRRDAVAVAQWLEGQMQQLQSTLEHQNLLPVPKSASPKPRMSSPNNRNVSPGSRQPMSQPRAHSARQATSAPSRGMGDGPMAAGTAPINTADPASSPDTAPAPGGQQQTHGASFQLTEDGRDAVLLVRDNEGFVSSAVLSHQEQLLTRCMEELCGQVGTLCVERGHLMWQLWAVLRHMLRLMVRDREMSRTAMREAQKTELAALESTRLEKTRIKEEMSEVERMNEVLNRRALLSRAEADQLKLKVTDLEAKLASLASANPAVLQAEIESLKESLAMAEKKVVNLDSKCEGMQKDLNDTGKEVAYLTSKLSEARAEMASMAGELAVRTPRPQQPRTPPWELVSDEETALAQQALREGCTAEDMHRLLLGVTFTNCNIMPWVDMYLGACRHWTPQATQTMVRAGGDDGGDGGDFEELPSPQRHPSPPKLKNVQSNGGLLRSASLAHSSVPSSAGGTRQGRRKSKLQSHMAALLPIRELQPQLAKIIATQNASVLNRTLPTDVVQAIAEMSNHGIDSNSIACLLLGSLSPEGVELTHFKPLAGILATKFNGTPSDIGGPITESLQVAALSTRERVDMLEKQVLFHHRLAVKLKRAVVEQRRQAEEQKEEEARKQARKFTRQPHPLKQILEAKRADYFTGLGMGDPSVPLVLQIEGKVYYRAHEKADAERTVHAIWRAKRDFEAANDVSVLLADYLYVFLHRKLGTPKAICEAAYNLLYTLGQHAYDPDCNLFLKVFMGDLDEEVKAAQDALKNQVLTLMRSVDERANSRPTGWLLKTEMRHVVKEHFSSKSEAQMNELFDALDSDEPREMVNYNRLFDDDSDLNQGVFAETLRQQHLNERLSFYQAVEDVVLDQAEKNGVDTCAPPALTSAFRKAHPNLTPEEIEEYVGRVFGTERGKKGLPLDNVLRMLRSPRLPRMVDAQAALDLVSANKGKQGRATGEGRAGRRTLVWGGNDESAAMKSTAAFTLESPTPQVPSLPMTPA